MNASDIKDSNTLQAWLKTRPQSNSVIIAHRIALRVGALHYTSAQFRQSQGFDLTALVVLRAVLTAGVVGNASTLAVYAAAADAAHAADAADAAGAATYAAAAAAAADAADAAAYATAAADAAESALLDDFEFYTAAAYAAADAIALQSGTDALTRPLWHTDTPPDWFNISRGTMRTYWQTESPTHWSFWQRWYDAAIAGKPLDWQLQHDIALIPDDIWQSGPSPVAEAIAKIEADHLAALTNNGERLEINPDTGLIRLVPETELPADIATYATRKMAKALAIFSDAADNQYRPLEPALKVIRDGLDDAANLPVELFDACASATRLVATLVRNDAVPSPDQDALINEFVTQLREAGADILANDRKTQDVLTRRNSILGNNALVENADAIQFVVQQLVKISEGTLVRALPRDAAIATQSDGDLAETKDSAFRLVSRVFRYKVVRLSAAVIATAALIESLEIIALALTRLIATPQFQQAWAAFLRWLGFA